MDHSFTQNTFEHQAYSFAYYIKWFYNNTLNEFRTYTGVDASNKFVEYLTADLINIYNNHLKHIIPILPLTKVEQNYDLAKTCHICEKKLDTDSKVKDHCHVSGKYRAAAHSTCNLNFKIKNFIPIFLHNLTNYDSHLFVKNLAFDNNKIEIIPLNC